MLIENIRTMMCEVCRHGTGPFDSVFFEKHIQVVADIADKLAVIYQADREVVALSSYLHDISAIEDYSLVSQHHILGSQRAEQILKVQGYPEDRIAAVRQCILTHSAPVALGQGTLEEVCISNADAASQIMMPGYWLHYAFCVKKLSYDQGLAWYRSRIDSHFSSMTAQAKAIAAQAYHLAYALFENEWSAFI